MKMYKGFDKDLQCRGFQFEIGKSYHEDSAKLCNTGFHACENPLDVFSYYPPLESRYCRVTLEGITTEEERDSKRYGTDIVINSEIDLKTLIDAATTGDFAHAATTGYGAHAATTGDRAHAATTGDGAHAATTGDRAHAATTGDFAHAATTGYGAHAATTGDDANAATTGDRANAATTGYRAHAATTGYRANAATTGDRANAVTTGCFAHAIVSGKQSIAAALGINSFAAAPIGGFIVLADWRENEGKCELCGVKTFLVDGKTIKGDTYYTLENGELMEER